VAAGIFRDHFPHFNDITAAKPFSGSEYIPLLQFDRYIRHWQTALRPIDTYKYRPLIFQKPGLPFLFPEDYKSSN